jgi:tRNA (mo5U34)-methyltransferase
MDELWHLLTTQKVAPIMLFPPSSNHPLWNHSEVPQVVQKSPGFSLSSIHRILEEREKWYTFANNQSLVQSFSDLPTISTSNVSQLLDQNESIVTIGQQKDISKPHEWDVIEKYMYLLSIWRKGPFRVFDKLIDAEWRSDLKWESLIPHLSILKNKRVLDVGASSGYYMYRMLPFKPKWILGIDPSVRFKLQFEFLNKYSKNSQLFYEMLGVEHLCYLPQFFDVIFCMGILYHQRSPIEALKCLKKSIAPKGTLFLETLVIPGEEDIVLSPYPAYGKMRNCYFLPTVPCLEKWLLRSGFKDIQILSLRKTTTEEQRRTEFCTAPAETLEHFLDPKDSSKTVEGYPAHLRVCLKAML